jgi:murein DD-endopeptidase MepM/ murein hydrolase activator NlpD
VIDHTPTPNVTSRALPRETAVFPGKFLPPNPLMDGGNTSGIAAPCPENRRSVLKQSITTWFLLLTTALLVLRVGGLTSAHDLPRERLINIVWEEDDRGVHFFVENLQLAQVTVTFEMDLVNLAAAVAFPYTVTCAGKVRTPVFSLTPTESGKRWSWSYKYHSTYGNHEAIHDDQYIYTLPYASGRSFRVSQGFDGEYSHFGANRFAVDWKMPVGTPVHAARGGLVVAVKNDSELGGPDEKYDSCANYILVQHSDGTLGHYVHLMKGGSRVKEGDRVRVGDWIGMSGNTGHSTGPHLHFAVFKTKDGKERETIPIRFRTTGGLASVLEQGRAYKAGAISRTYAIAKDEAVPENLTAAIQTAETAPTLLQHSQSP